MNWQDYKIGDTVLLKPKIIGPYLGSDNNWYLYYHREPIELDYLCIEGGVYFAYGDAWEYWQTDTLEEPFKYIKLAIV